MDKTVSLLTQENKPNKSNDCNKNNSNIVCFILTTISTVIFIIINSTDIIQAITINETFIFKTGNFCDIIGCNPANLKRVYYNLF